MISTIWFPCLPPGHAEAPGLPMAIPEGLPAAISTSLFFSRKRIRPATLTYPGVRLEEIPSGVRTITGVATFILQHLPQAARPHFLAHSLGCPVALETMNRLQEQGLSAGQGILLAGAVDCDALARGTRSRACTQAAARLQVLSSKIDRVLQWWFPIGALLAGLFFGGYTRSTLGRVGSRPSPSREAVPGTVAALTLQDAWQVGHGDYLAKADGHLNAKHLSSAHLAAGVLLGGPAVYPPP